MTALHHDRQSLAGGELEQYYKKVWMRATQIFLFGARHHEKPSTDHGDLETFLRVQHVQTILSYYQSTVFAIIPVVLQKMSEKNRQEENIIKENSSKHILNAYLNNP